MDRRPAEVMTVGEVADCRRVLDCSSAQHLAHREKTLRQEIWRFRREAVERGLENRPRIARWSQIQTKN